MECVDVTEQGQISEQFNILAHQRINLAASVEEFISHAATELNERVMQDLQELTKPSRRRSRGSRSRRSSNCLLYTSPSPRDGLLSRMPSSA